MALKQGKVHIEFYCSDRTVNLFSSVEEFGGSLSVDAITEFVDEGGNILVAGSSQVINYKSTGLC